MAPICIPSEQLRFQNINAGLKSPVLQNKEKNAICCVCNKTMLRMNYKTHLLRTHKDSEIAESELLTLLNADQVCTGKQKEILKKLKDSLP